MGILQKYDHARRMVWGQKINDESKYQKCKLGVSSHAALCGVTDTEISCVIGIIACVERVCRKVNGISSLVTVLSLKYCKACFRQCGNQTVGRRN